MLQAIQTLIAVGTFCGFVSAGAAGRADSKKPDSPPSEFERVIAEIRSAQSSDAWKRPGWNVQLIEQTLQGIVNNAKVVTKRDLELPIAFKDVNPQRTNRDAAVRGGVLRVLNRSADLSFVDRSILLVDGSVRISFASDCMIVARGAVEIAHSNHCLVVAGQHVNISHDGNGGFGPGANGRAAAAGSIVVSGGSIDISHAHGTVISAPQQVTISHATGADFIASPRRDVGDRGGCNYYDKAAPLLMIPAPATLPASILTVRQVVAPDDHSKQLVTVQRNGIEYVLRPGDKIADERGAPISGWEKWTLGFVTDNFALFTDGNSDVGVRTQ